MTFILGLIIGIIYLVVLVLAEGYTLSTLWNDFIPQIFPALPHLNFYQALAVSLVIGLFTMSNGKIYDQDDELAGWKQCVNSLTPFLRCGFALLFGIWLKTHLS